MILPTEIRYKKLYIMAYHNEQHVHMQCLFSSKVKLKEVCGEMGKRIKN